MSFESPRLSEGSEKKERTPLELKMEIQRAMVQAACMPDDTMDKCVKDWIKVNGESFAFAFDTLISERADLNNLWESDPTFVMQAFYNEMDELEGKREAA